MKNSIKKQFEKSSKKRPEISSDVKSVKSRFSNASKTSIKSRTVGQIISIRQTTKVVQMNFKMKEKKILKVYIRYK